jgi:hypothetical protein
VAAAEQARRRGPREGREEEQLLRKLDLEQSTARLVRRCRNRRRRKTVRLGRRSGIGRRRDVARWGLEKEGETQDGEDRRRHLR